mgnify:CR=1 FL=1
MTDPIQFSDNNHWKFGWGKGLYNFDQQQQPMWVTFGPCQRQPKTFDLEMAATVRRVADNASKPIYVAMSGGIDSELIARMMLQERVPFTPLIVQFEEDLNQQDISYAFEFCKNHQLTPEIMKLDIVNFFKTCVDTPYILTNCTHLMQMHIMRQARHLGGMTVIGTGEQCYEGVDGQIAVTVPQERIAVTHFMQVERVHGVSAFYYYTPELMLSLLREAKEIGFQNMSKFAHNIKEAIYRKFWPDLLPRPKLSGFEKIDGKRLATQEKLKKRLLERCGTSILSRHTIPIDILEKQLTEVLAAP